MTPSETAQELEVGNLTTTPHHLNKGNPSFHLVITGAKKSPQLCRSLLSAAILDYPPPTLINYDDGAQTSQSKINDAKKVHDFLQSSESGLRENDAVLVIDGGSTLFQLPASVLLHRYETTHALLNSAPNRDSQPARTMDSRQGQAVFLGASDACSLTGSHEACSSLPAPTLHAKTPKAVQSKYVDGEISLGLAPEMKRLFMATSGEVGAGGIKDSRDIMTRLYAEQEISRKSAKSRQTGFRTGWKVFTEHRPWRSSEGRADAEASLARDREFGMALDYKSSLFSSTSALPGNLTITQSQINASRLHGSAIPADIATAPAPVRPVPITYVDASHNTSTLMFNSTIDQLDGNLSWYNLPLMADARTSSIPTIIHYRQPEKHEDDSWALWRQMWYHPYARALMRNHLRSAEGPAAVQASLSGGDRDPDTRGGKGGFWTESGVWLEFGEVCRGYEGELFGDGYGEWGLEGGGHPRCDINDNLFSGEGDCVEIKKQKEDAEKTGGKVSHGSEGHQEESQEEAHAHGYE